MPGSWDPVIYREHARRWLEEAEKLPPGTAREICVTLAEGYNRLADLIDADPDGLRVAASPRS